MALMDEFKKEREAVKSAPLKQKITYFWYYYKWPVIGVIAAVVFITSYIYSVVTEPETLLTGILLNTLNESIEDPTTDLRNDFIKELELDSSEYTIFLNPTLIYSVSAETDINTSNYEAIQVILAQSATGTLDFITGDQTAMVDLAYREYFVDLTEVLSEEQLAMYEPYLLYVDKTIVEEIDETAKRNEDTSGIELPDCRKSETMTEPIPVLIDVSQSQKLRELYKYPFDSLSFGVVNTENAEMIIKFMDFILE